MANLQAEDAKKLNEALGMFGNQSGRDSDDTEDADSGDDSDFKAAAVNAEDSDDGSSTEEESDNTPPPQASPEPKKPEPKKPKKPAAGRAGAGRGRGGGRAAGRGAKTPAAGKTKAPPKAKPPAKSPAKPAAKKLEQQKLVAAAVTPPAPTGPAIKDTPAPGPPARTASCHSSELRLKFKVAAQKERINLFATNMAMIQSIAEINGKMLLEGIPEEMEGVINTTTM